MNTPAPQIIAAGGASPIEAPNSLAFYRYILDQAARPRPAICFLPTASGDTDRNLVSFYSTFSRLDCRPSHLGFFGRTPDLRPHLLAQDVICVGGGNTKSMLAVWRDWGVPEILREAWENGVVLAGSSAGAICWFEQGLSDYSAAGLRVLPCLGFLSGSCCPHYDSEVERRPTYQQAVGSGQAIAGYAMDDNVALHFIGTRLHRIVATLPGKRAYWVSRDANGSAREEILPVEVLGASSP